MKTSQLSQLISDREGAEIFGCSRATWWRRVADGTIPKPIKLGGLSRWRLSDVEAVIEKADAARTTPPSQDFEDWELEE